MAKADEEQGTGGWVVKASAVICLAAILFALLVMVIGAWMGEEEDVPALYVYLGAGSCGVFSLSALTGIGVWVTQALSEK